MIDGKETDVSASSFCVVAPKTEHTELLGERGEVMFVGFRSDGKSVPCGILQNTEPETLLLFHRIFDEFRNQYTGYKTAINSLLNLIILSSLRRNSTENKKCRDLDYIKTYIEQYYNSKINFKELSALSGYSFDYFRHIFKQKFGVSPQEYMIDIRIQNAKRLLETSNLSCTEIAYRCGFSNSAQMSTMFKEKFGVSPTHAK
jgi:AraC family transcriptional activator of pobA